MARRADPITMAEVRLHLPQGQAQTVGWLSRVGDNQRMSFAPDYIGDPRRPTLSQLYSGQTPAQTQAILSAVNDRRLVRIGLLPSWFSNLLPEGANRDRLAAQRGCDVGDEFELLAAAGHDLSGAVEVVPAQDVPHSVLQLHSTLNLEPLEPNALAAPVDDGFSVDGVQTKFSMVEAGRHYVVRRGTEAGDFIAKLPQSNRPDLVRNEAACYGLSAAVGMTTAKVSVQPTSALQLPQHVIERFEDVLMVERFDRRRLPGGKRIRVHFEELAQAIGLDSRQKYGGRPDGLQAAMRALLVILKVSDAAGQADIDEVFRRWTAYALMGNTDAHLKNWGLIYPDGVNARLAPAYDIVSVASYFDDKDKLALAHNRAIDVTLRKWDEDAAEALAKSAGLLSFNRARKIVRDTRAQAAERWPQLLHDAPDAVRQTVTQRLAELAPAAAAQRPGPTPRQRPS